MWVTGKQQKSPSKNEDMFNTKTDTLSEQNGLKREKSKRRKTSNNP